MVRVKVHSKTLPLLSLPQVHAYWLQTLLRQEDTCT